MKIGQISLFILLGVVILIILGLIFLLTSGIVKGLLQQQDVTMSSCLESAVQLQIMETDIFQSVPTIEEMEQQFAHSITNNFINCIQYYSLDSRDATITIEAYDSSFSVSLTYPLGFDTKNFQYNYDTLYYTYYDFSFSQLIEGVTSFITGRDILRLPGTYELYPIDGVLYYVATQEDYSLVVKQNP
jgi:hypothetical protein